MQNINASQLKSRLDAGENIKLVNALEENKFRMKHIPGSLNIFRREEIQSQLNTDDEIVVYCTDAACNKSIILYQLMEALGYSHVYRFAGGLMEWEREGFELEGEMIFSA